MDAMPLTLGAGNGRVAHAGRGRHRAPAGLPAATARARARRHRRRHRHQRAARSSPPRAAALLSQQTGLDLRPSRDFFAALAAQDTAVELSGQLRTLAVSLMKIANDLRWMNSGPLAGLGEIALPALQPGSSIMPGKVNPGRAGGGHDGRAPRSSATT